jgi:multidrug resistance efflux pump
LIHVRTRRCSINTLSPVDGTVVSRNVTQGQTVAASFQTPTLFLIASDLKRMQVDTNVSESDIGGIKEGADSELCRARPPSGG